MGDSLLESLEVLRFLEKLRDLAKGLRVLHSRWDSLAFFTDVSEFEGHTRTYKTNDERGQNIVQFTKNLSSSQILMAHHDLETSSIESISSVTIDTLDRKKQAGSGVKVEKWWSQFPDFVPCLSDGLRKQNVQERMSVHHQGGGSPRHRWSKSEQEKMLRAMRDVMVEMLTLIKHNVGQVTRFATTELLHAFGTESVVQTREVCRCGSCAKELSAPCVSGDEIADLKHVTSQTACCLTAIHLSHLTHSRQSCNKGGMGNKAACPSERAFFLACPTTQNQLTSPFYFFPDFPYLFSPKKELANSFEVQKDVSTDHFLQRPLSFTSSLMGTYDLLVYKSFLMSTTVSLEYLVFVEAPQMLGALMEALTPLGISQGKVNNPCLVPNKEGTASPGTPKDFDCSTRNTGQENTAASDISTKRCLVGETISDSFWRRFWLGVAERSFYKVWHSARECEVVFMTRLRKGFSEKISSMQDGPTHDQMRTQATQLLNEKFESSQLSPNFQSRASETEIIAFDSEIGPPHSKIPWRKAEDKLLLELAQKHLGRSWKVIAAELNMRIQSEAQDCTPDFSPHQILSDAPQPPSIGNSENSVREASGRKRRRIAENRDSSSVCSLREKQPAIYSRSAYECFKRHVIRLNRGHVTWGQWSGGEDALLCKLARQCGMDIVDSGSSQGVAYRWHGISEHLGRSYNDCRNRYVHVLKQTNHQCWNPSEDARLQLLAIAYNSSWVSVAVHMARSAPQCRERHELIQRFPSKKTGEWSEEEQNRLLETVSMIGPGKWAETVKLAQLDGWTDRQCSEQWRTLRPIEAARYDIRRASEKRMLPNKSVVKRRGVEHSFTTLTGSDVAIADLEKLVSLTEHAAQLKDADFSNKPSANIEISYSYDRLLQLHLALAAITTGDARADVILNRSKRYVIRQHEKHLGVTKDAYIRTSAVSQPLSGAAQPKL